MYILIAGFENQTKNYQQALECLGARTAHFTWEFQSSAQGFFNGKALAGRRETSLGPLPLLPDSLTQFDGLLLPGGGDIHPELFGQSNQGSKQVDLWLDLLQLHLFHTFYQAQKPILGICKGMQLINIALGGSILQDLPKEKRLRHAYQGRDQVHPTEILPDTFLFHLYGPCLVTNSAHHQAVDKLGEKLLPAQYSPDGLMEALFHPNRRVLGVQWHPERMFYSINSPLSSPASEQKENQKTGDGSLVLRYFLSLCSPVH